MLHLVAFLVANTVVVGVGDVDGSSTTISTLTLGAGAKEARATARCTLPHQRGMVPPGTLVDDQHVALTLAVGSTRAGAVVVVDLRDCTQRELVDEVIPQQAPLVVDGHVIAVRQLDPDRAGATFDVVSVPLSGGPTEVLASRQALWVTPARGASSTSELRFLIGEGAGDSNGDTPSPDDGRFHLDHLEHGDFQQDIDLGRGVFRSPLATGELEVEDGKHAVLRDARGKVLVRGLPGLSPIRAGQTLATSTGKKDGTILLNGLERKSGRAGIARPQAISTAGGVVVVVVWIDRGASLPGELWSIGAKTSTRLLPPKERTAVMVYGSAR
jgi:hypothetical protein